MTSLMNLITYDQLLDKEIAKLEVIISSAPKGSLVSRISHKVAYIYTKKVSLPGGRSKEFYLGKEPTPEAIHLAQKALAKKRLPFLLKEKELVSSMLMNRKEECVAADYLEQHPGLSILLSSGALLTDQKNYNWKHAPYKRNQNYPEQLRYTTVVPGLMVRSKAEADIIACLERYGVAYHYEEIHTINGIEYAIDLTCLNARTGMKWYWDHRGMLDNPNYIQKTLNCDAAYLKAGIIPWINLIVTTETKDHPLDLHWVNTLVQYYLL